MRWTQGILSQLSTFSVPSNNRAKAPPEPLNENAFTRSGGVVAFARLDQDLRRALERKEFRLHYQPIVLLETGKVIGFEALLRWERPEAGLVLPGEFILHAEETGLIIPIGRWVVGEACRQVHAWEAQFRTDLSVSVNVSVKQFSQPDLVDQITQTLQEFSLDERSLNLEITESVIMENVDSVIAILHQLRALRVHSHMDDFGTGYSSLSYLHRLPIDAVKIDRSFVSGNASGIANPGVVRTIVTLVRDLGMNVIAEGVETEEQRAQLTALGCKYGQGYLFFKPLDAEEAGKLIPDIWGGRVTEERQFPEMDAGKNETSGPDRAKPKRL